MNTTAELINNAFCMVSNISGKVMLGLFDDADNDVRKVFNDTVSHSYQFFNASANTVACHLWKNCSNMMRVFSFYCGYEYTDVGCSNMVNASATQFTEDLCHNLESFLDDENEDYVAFFSVAGVLACMCICIGLLLVDCPQRNLKSDDQCRPLLD